MVKLQEQYDKNKPAFACSLHNTLLHICVPSSLAVINSWLAYSAIAIWKSQTDGLRSLLSQWPPLTLPVDAICCNLKFCPDISCLSQPVHALWYPQTPGLALELAFPHKSNTRNQLTSPHKLNTMASTPLIWLCYQSCAHGSMAESTFVIQPAAWHAPGARTPLAQQTGLQCH